MAYINCNEIGDKAAVVTEGPHGGCRVTVMNTSGYKKLCGTVPRNDTVNKETARSGVIANSPLRREPVERMRTFGHQSNGRSNRCT